MRKRTKVAGVIGIIAVGGIIAGSVTGGSPKTQVTQTGGAVTSPAVPVVTRSAGPVSTPPASPPASTPAEVPPKPRVVASFSGSGTTTTRKFTVSDTWQLTYKFDCANMGGTSGVFQVYEDGGRDLNGVFVNVLAAAKSGSTFAYGDAGTHYLLVNTGCDWSARVVSQ